MSDLQRIIDRYVKPNKLLPLLRTKGVVTQDEFETLNQTSTHHQQVSFICETITFKGQSSLDGFIAALKEETDHPPHQVLAEMLEATLEGSYIAIPPEITLIEDVISPHLSAFVDCVNPHELLPNLMKYQLITGDEFEYFSSSSLTTSRLNCHLFCKLRCCGPDAMEKFIYCLIKEKKHLPHHKLAECLVQQMSTLKQHCDLVHRLEQALHDETLHEACLGSATNNNY